MIEIKVAMKCYNIQAQNHLEHLAEGSSVQNTSLWVILQRKAMFGCVITMERVVVQNVGSAESIYSRSIPFCHQERPRCGRQVVLAPLQWGIKDNESRHLIGELDPVLWWLIQLELELIAKLLLVTAGASLLSPFFLI